MAIFWKYILRIYCHILWIYIQEKSFNHCFQCGKRYESYERHPLHEDMAYLNLQCHISVADTDRVDNTIYLLC